MQRGQRKLEHIKYAMQLADGPRTTGFEDLVFVHNCLPEINPADVDLTVTILGKRLRLPFFIDAITGSTDAVTGLNEQLAQIAALAGIGLAVGSQYGAVTRNEGIDSYKIVRTVNPHGLVMANINAQATPQQAQAAVTMLDADALQIHLNAVQELWMSEGDKDFSFWLNNMKKIRETIAVPVIVKETGFGIARRQYDILLENKFTCFDCAGTGGTNFAAIEAKRSGINIGAEFLNWGHPTCWSLLDAGHLSAEALLIASGGIRTCGDVARAFALGADAVAITGPVLKLLLTKGVDAAVEFFNRLGDELKKYMLLLGCSRVYSLRKVPLIIKGATRNYIDCCKYDLAELCNSRRSHQIR